MDSQILTNLIFGGNSDLHQDISYLQMELGSWCLTVHSVSVEEASFEEFEGHLEISCNLITTRSSRRRLTSTPLVCFPFKKNSSSNSHHYFYPRKHLINNRASSLVFKYNSINGESVPLTSKIAVHFTLERFS